MEGSIEFQITNFKSQITHRQRGFSLAEIIIVLGIVGIITSGILPLFLNVITADKTASFYSIAYKIADSKIEEYRNESFDNLTVGNETASIGELPGGESQTIITNQIDGSNEADMRKVDLRIRWYFKRDQEVRIVTYVYRNGL